MSNDLLASFSVVMFGVTGVCGTLIAEVKVKRRLTCWQKDCSGKALEGNYQWNDVVRLKTRDAPVSSVKASNTQTDRSLLLRHTQTHTWPLSRLCLLFYLRPYLTTPMIKQYSHFFITFSTYDVTFLYVEECEEIHLFQKID